MTDERITWPERRRIARECAVYDVSNGDDRDAADIAHEDADGSADVIYYWRALALYQDSAEVSGYADEAMGYVPPDERTPERIASICVYLALRAEIEDAIIEWREAQEDAETCDTCNGEGFIPAIGGPYGHVDCPECSQEVPA